MTKVARVAAPEPVPERVQAQEQEPATVQGPVAVQKQEGPWVAARGRFPPDQSIGCRGRNR